MSSLICPHCQYENVVVTCGFCLQCGFDVVVTEDGASESVERSQSPDRILADAVAAKFNTVAVETADSQAVRIALSDDRAQVVHFQTDDQDNSCVAIFSICGPAAERNALPLLTWNSRLTDSFFSSRKIDGQAMFVLESRQRFNQFETMNATTAATHLGQLADSVEAKISAGADQY